MNLRSVLMLCFLFVAHSMNAQRVGEWHSYLASYNTTSVVEANNRVFGLADGTLYSYGKEDNRVTFYSKQTGLSDTGIKLIGYNATVQMLLIAYTNGNIDLMGEDDSIYNLPFLMNMTNIPNKEITGVYFHNKTAYLSTKFGISEIRMGDKKEFGETYKLNLETYATYIQGDFIFAATEKGILKTSAGNNPSDPNNWNVVTLDTSDFKQNNIRQLCEFKGMLCFFAETAGIFYLDSNGDTKTLVKNASLKGMKFESERLITFTSSTMYMYESMNQYESANVGIVNDVSSLKNNADFWIAGGSNGLIGVKRKAENQYEPFVSGLNTEGPKRNLDAFMTMHGRKLLVTGGGGNPTNRFFNPGTLMTLENGKWINFDENKVNQQVGYKCLDYTAVAVDPDDENHYFVSTYGEGVLEIKDNAFVQLYNHKNSPLQSIVPQGDASRYVRVGSVSFDKNKNLWMTNCEVRNGIVVRKADGTWLPFYFPGLNNAHIVDKILITSKGQKWVNVPHNGNGSTGMLVFDETKTTDNSHFYSTFQSGTSNALNGNTFYCMAEDLSGTIWVGTNNGPIYCTNPTNAIENPDKLRFSQVYRKNESGIDYYFLSGEQINAIAVDGGNRKWIGTSSSGVFLISPDDNETILHFDVNNSPLYSNNILTITIDDQTGEVFFGTDKGLISYVGEAIEPSKSYSDVYAYPNPVRPAFDDQVVITGLMSESNVKITDLSGNLIYQAKSAGGQLMWNCRNRNGSRVATGIYLVLSSTPEAKESVVAKIAVVQ